MTNPITLSITIPGDAASAFRDAAQRAGMDLGSFGVDCILDRIENAARYRTMLARIAAVDEAIIQIAGIVGEMAADDDGRLDLSQICKAACQSGYKE